MKIKIKILPKKISYFFKKYHFLILGVVLVVLLAFNVFIYYKYVYLTVNAQIQPAGEEITINNDVLDKVMKNINEREDNLLRVETRKYYNPFND